MVATVRVRVAAEGEEVVRAVVVGWTGLGWIGLGWVGIGLTWGGKQRKKVWRNVWIHIAESHLHLVVSSK